MTSSTLGASISQVEVTNIDRFGFWLLVEDREYFLPYADFPWFRTATVEQILDVQLLQDKFVILHILKVPLILHIKLALLMQKHYVYQPTH